MNYYRLLETTLLDIKIICLGGPHRQSRALAFVLSGTYPVNTKNATRK